jgi:hypothetical protein
VSTTPANPSIPADWGTGTTLHTLALSTTVATTVAAGGYGVTITVTGAASGVSRDDSYNVNIDSSCAPAAPTNTAPAVAFTTAPTTANEGDTKTYDFAITDPNAADTHAFVANSPSCGTDGEGDPNELVSSSIDQALNTGTFVCRFIDGLKPAGTSAVTVQVTDGAASSNVPSTTVTVNNLAPSVTGTPSFASTSIDCQVSVALTGIAFSDAGVEDDDWTVDIDWGDGSAHTSVTAGTQGTVANQSHTYTTGGTFTAKVKVTDKDGDASSQVSSSNTVTVQQYEVDFLPPFDDSTPSGLIVNQMKNGRTVPVKATIEDLCAGGYVTSPSAVTIRVNKVTAPTTNPVADAVENYADAGASSSNTNLFRWNADATSPTGGFWIYNLDSKALALQTNSFYRVDIWVDSAKATTDNWGILQPVK